MAKLRLDIKSTTVFGVYGIVNIVLNGTNLALSKQLSATVESLEYNVDILTSSNNVLKIALINDIAQDVDGDGDYNSSVDKTMQAIVSSLSYAVDNVNFTTLLPQAFTTFTIPSGLPGAGIVGTATNSVTQFTSYGLDYAITFNSDGIVNTEYCSGLLLKLLENGNVIDYYYGKTYDPNGNVLSAP